MNVSPDKPGGLRIPELDGIRGLAISLVLFQHYVVDPIVPGRNPAGDFIASRLNVGWTGVDLFFVLSGFLIGGILMDHRGSENYFKAFYARRCCRILPPYLLCLAGGYTALSILASAHGSQEWYLRLFTGEGNPPPWVNLLFLQNAYEAFTGKLNGEWLNPTWSLAVEEQFYLLLPLLIWLVRPVRLLPILFCVILIYPLAQLFLLMFDTRVYDLVSKGVRIRGDALLVGVICAIIVRRPKWKDWLIQNDKALPALFVFLFLGMCYLAQHYSAGTYLYDQILVYNLWVAIFYACLLLLAVTCQNGIVAKTIRFAPLRKLGMISYGVYLFHVPILSLVYGLGLGRIPTYQKPSDIFLTTAAFALTLVFTSLLWYFAEKPMIAWGHSVCYRKPK